MKSNVTEKLLSNEWITLNNEQRLFEISNK